MSSRTDGLSCALRHSSQALLAPTSKDAADSASLLALGRAGQAPWPESTLTLTRTQRRYLVSDGCPDGWTGSLSHCTGSLREKLALGPPWHKTRDSYQTKQQQHRKPRSNCEDKTNTPGARWRDLKMVQTRRHH